MDDPPTICGELMDDRPMSPILFKFGKIDETLEEFYSLYPDRSVDDDTQPDTTSNYSKPTSYSSGSDDDAPDDVGNDTDSLYRGQGSTLSTHSVSSRCTSVSRASSIARQRVLDSLRGLSIASPSIASASWNLENSVQIVSNVNAPSTTVLPVENGDHVDEDVNQSGEVASPTTSHPNHVSVPLTRNVLEWHNEETAGTGKPQLAPSTFFNSKPNGDISTKHFDLFQGPNYDPIAFTNTVVPVYTALCNTSPAYHWADPKTTSSETNLNNILNNNVTLPSIPPTSVVNVHTKRNRVSDSEQDSS
eukprot:NODE_2302_length_1621_cov_52.993992_g1974_i0.p1 GENE.NODE_2302_length_1621_cov_52.993992_g1974_i0~~NODE_2302_length_1621_cov_52.993992_g1974_i0.p1  ORF type:complete len:304 (+),score=58.09 NODE_2302_length_1621_cov_52.993992_g1974_i0:614-1525(+)